MVEITCGGEFFRAAHEMIIPTSPGDHLFTAAVYIDLIGCSEFDFVSGKVIHILAHRMYAWG